MKRRSQAQSSDKTPAIRTRPGRARLSSLEIYDRRTFRLFLRILGYIDGAWRKSRNTLPFLDWNYERFARKTKTRGGKSVQVRTLERQFPRFQRWCQEYYFTEINVGGKWVIRIMRNPSVQSEVPGAHVLDRLVLAIRSYVAKSGRARIDLEFCRKFSAMSALPLNEVEHVWRGLKKIPGLKHKWRGVGRGRKFVIEDPARWAAVLDERKNKILRSRDPQTLPPVSISYGNERSKNSRSATDGPDNRPPASPASGDASDNSQDKPPPTVSQTCHESPADFPVSVRSPSGSKPLQICGRWISGRKLLALATWLAVARLKFVHVNRERVRWYFAHSRNFANRALRFGYDARAIEKAYLRGVDRSHEDALDGDRMPGGGYASQREPSAAVVYAWRELRESDARGSEELWSEFFAASRRGKLAPAAAPKATRGPAPRMSAAEAAARLAELREKIAPAKRDQAESSGAGGVTLGELAKFLKTKPMSMAQFASLSYIWKKQLIAQAATWIDSESDR